MKHIKTLAIAAFAAMALAASLGAGGAAAETTLCKANESPCGGGNGYGAGTTLKATTGTVGLGSTGGSQNFTTSCASSTLEATLETATTPKGKISTLSWSECSYPIVVTSKGSLEIHHETEGNGQVTVSGVSLEVKNTLWGTCVYGGTIEGMKLTGGNPARLDVFDYFERQGGSLFCPPQLMWLYEYEVQQPKPVYATAGL
jgi:hypothetical protein